MKWYDDDINPVMIFFLCRGAKPLPALFEPCVGGQTPTYNFDRGVKPLPAYHCTGIPIQRPLYRGAKPLPAVVSSEAQSEELIKSDKKEKNNTLYIEP